MNNFPILVLLTNMIISAQHSNQCLRTKLSKIRPVVDFIPIALMDENKNLVIPSLNESSNSNHSIAALILNFFGGCLLKIYKRFIARFERRRHFIDSLSYRDMS